MRHDPAAGAVVIMLRSLKMYGMAQAVTECGFHEVPDSNYGKSRTRVSVSPGQ